MDKAAFAEANALIAVLEQKSFRKAANQLGLSPPRVSDLVRSLEARLGVRLVERTTRSVAATVAGDRLHERLRPVLDEYEAALASTYEFRAKAAGTLRLTVAPPAAELVLKEAIPQFLSLYPEITVEISLNDALTDIVAGRFDAGIRAGRTLARDMIAVRVSDAISLVVVASPAYLAEHGTPKTPRDLTEHDCIRIRFPSGGFLPWRFRTKRYTRGIRVEGQLIVNDSAFAIRAAVQGTGLLQLPPDYVAAELSSGQLKTLLDDWAPSPLDGFFIYYPSRRQGRSALKALVDFFRDRHRRGSAKRAGSQRF